MKKIAVFASGLLLILASASAQSNTTVHVIKEGETLSQLAKKYGTTVGDIMRLNKMTSDSKLFVNEEVKIPGGGAGDQGQASTPTPAVTSHVVEKGETLYQLSRNYGLSVNQIRDWNNITGNSIQVGQTLRLTAPSAGDLPVATPSAPVATTPAVTNEVPVASTVTDQAATNSAGTNTATSTDAVAGDAPVATKQRDQSVFDPNSTATAGSSAEGAFATAYKSQANGTEMITKGSAGEFKSASGWKDGKYFILMNEVAPGTLVKVQTKGKTVYAKVLWNLGNVKENAGLSYRISDAAAGALGLSGESYDIIVSYFKQNAD